MEEKDFKGVGGNNSEKLNWEVPKLLCLDKGKTEGGYESSVIEDTELGSGILSS